MEKLKQMFSPQKKETEGSTETLSAKETETGPVRPLESTGMFAEGHVPHSQQSNADRHDTAGSSLQIQSEQERHSQVGHTREVDETASKPGGSTDPRELNEQPAKEKMHTYLDEHPDKHPMVTTTSTTTHTAKKDVTSTATMNPTSETYTTTTTYKKDDNA